MTRKIIVNGKTVWCKTYDKSSGARRAITPLWNRLPRRLGVRALYSPPRPHGDGARRLEQRRIGELRRRGVRVPEVIGEGDRLLLLSDLGPSLSSRLKQAANHDEVDDLVHRGVASIVDVHRREAYLGQAVARNIIMTDGGAGFIDFEEDPLEVMTLGEAQARDWLLFSSSVARYYEGRVGTLATMLGQALPEVGGEVVETVDHAARRLGFLERWTRMLGSRARALGVAVASLRGSRILWLLLLVVLADFISDGDSDILLALQLLQ